MASTNLNINLAGIVTALDTPLKAYLKKNIPKMMFLSTYTLGYEAIMELNALAKKGTKIRVIYAKLHNCVPEDAKFTLYENAGNHTKIWLVDNKAFVGSANLTSDTIGNVMVEIHDTSLKQHLNVLMELLMRRNTPIKKTRFL